MVSRSGRQEELGRAIRIVGAVAQLTYIWALAQLAQSAAADGGSHRGSGSHSQPCWAKLGRDFWATEASEGDWTPRCDVHGDFEPIQCTKDAYVAASLGGLWAATAKDELDSTDEIDTRECFCVDTVTGTEMADSRVRVVSFHPDPEPTESMCGSALSSSPSMQGVVAPSDGRHHQEPGAHADACTVDRMVQRLHSIDEVCCDQQAGCADDGGLPLRCSVNCAAAVLPFWRECNEQLLNQMESVFPGVNSVAGLCRDTPAPAHRQPQQQQQMDGGMGMLQIVLAIVCAGALCGGLAVTLKRCHTRKEDFDPALSMRSDTSERAWESAALWNFQVSPHTTWTMVKDKGNRLRTTVTTTVSRSDSSSKGADCGAATEPSYPPPPTVVVVNQLHDEPDVHGAEGNPVAVAVGESWVERVMDAYDVPALSAGEAEPGGDEEGETSTDELLPTTSGEGESDTTSSAAAPAVAGDSFTVPSGL